jgi:hypothetical protein
MVAPSLVPIVKTPFIMNFMLLVPLAFVEATWWPAAAVSRCAESLR